MGVANQMLAAIGLGVGTTYLLQHAAKRKYALCTAVPFVLVAVTVFTAGIASFILGGSAAAAESRHGRRGRVVLPLDVRC